MPETRAPATDAIAALGVGGTRLGDGGFESSSQSRGTPTGWTETAFWGNLEGPGFVGSPPVFRTNPEQCVVPTGGFCTGDRFVYSGWNTATHLDAVIGRLPGSGAFGVGFTEDALWKNPKSPDGPQSPDFIQAFIVKAGSKTNFRTGFEPFTGTWHFGLAFAMLTTAQDRGSDATLEFLTPAGTPIPLLRVQRDQAQPLGVGVQAYASPNVTPFDGARTGSECTSSTYSYCSGWQTVSIDVTPLASSTDGYLMRLIVSEGLDTSNPPQLTDAPVAFAFDDFSLQATIAASGAEGGTIALVAPRASYMMDEPTIQPLSYSWTLDSNALALGCVLDAAGTATPTVTGCVDDGVVGITLDAQYAKEPPGGGTPSPAGETITGSLTLNNLAPVVAAIAGAPTDPVAIGTPLVLSAAYQDPGVLDTHTAELDWGDSTTPCSAVGGVASGCSAAAAPGVYTLRMAVTDDDAATGLSDPFSYIVVYDPTAGFVTGGGWIESPAGAYVPNAGLSGRATFGFVSRYKRGAALPSGNTEFQFRAAGLTFRSTVYDWLVVAGARAQFKGTGTVNGSGDFAFMLTAVDGDVNGGGGIDRFRLKIWNRETDAILYDNELGTDDTSLPVTALGGGSIVIHQK